MKKYIKKIGVFALLAALLAWFSPFGATAAAPAFDASGVYVVAFNYLGTDYAHDMVLAQDGLGNLTGNGGSPSGANTYTWVVTSGSVSGNAIDFFADYTATPDAVVPQTTMHVTGTIAPNGSMSGNWTDNYQGGARGGTWMLTSGAATPFLMVDDDGAECPGAAYTTIQAAVNAASPGDTITVCAGTYPEHVSVNKALTINGPNSGIPGQSVRGAEAIVDGTDTGAAFAVTANDVAIDGFTVKNGSDGGLYSGIWVQTGTQNLKVANNVITQNGFGVWAQCGGNCLIEDNLFDGNNKPGPGNGGISADNTNGLSINNNEFKNHNSGNPILLQAVSPGAHNNVSITNNNFHDNTIASVMYILAVSGGVISGNTILPASDVTGISLSGANTNVDIHHNVITGGIRGVRVEDAGYYGGSGGNSNITVNRNNVSGNSGYGVGNTDAAIANLDATCNWWGAVNGAGPVGAGSGSPVTGNVNFTPWLTSSDLENGLCNGPLLPVTVTIVKYVNGVHATAGNANSASFPMNASWDADNIGAGNGSYALSPAGFNNPNPYEATTAQMTSGADYSTEEDLTTATVGSACGQGKPFALLGYSVGDTLVDAENADLELDAPALTNITSNKYIIVWNAVCPAPVPAANACAAPLPFGWTQVNGTSGADDVTLDPFTKFVGNGGNDKVKGPNAGDYIVCTGGGNDTITLASGNYWVEAGNGKNTITAGTGDGTIKSGTGADTITTGGGSHTINAGNGNNVITTGSGNDNITTGTGRDVINAGGGNNVVVSGSGNDIVITGSGNDNINGGLGFDICQAGGGTNTKSGCEL